MADLDCTHGVRLSAEPHWQNVPVVSFSHRLIYCVKSKLLSIPMRAFMQIWLEIRRADHQVIVRISYRLQDKPAISQHQQLMKISGLSKIAYLQEMPCQGDKLQLSSQVLRYFGA